MAAMVYDWEKIQALIRADVLKKLPPLRAGEVLVWEVVAKEKSHGFSITVAVTIVANEPNPFR